MRDLGGAPRPTTVVIEDRVRDLMVLTVPRLAADEPESHIGPDRYLEDDGCAERFAKAFIFDDMPKVEIEDDLFALMRLTDPSLDPAVDSWPEDICAEAEDDGLDEQWAVPGYVVPEYPMAIAAPAPMPMISAPSCAGASVLPAAEVKAAIGASVAVPAIAAPEEEYVIDGSEDIPEDGTVLSFGKALMAPLVTFTFGPATADRKGWQVSFSF